MPTRAIVSGITASTMNTTRNAPKTKTGQQKHDANVSLRWGPWPPRTRATFSPLRRVLSGYPVYRMITLPGLPVGGAPP